MFHHECLAEWKRTQGHSAPCPLCRRSLDANQNNFKTSPKIKEELAPAKKLAAARSELAAAKLKLEVALQNDPALLLLVESDVNKLYDLVEHIGVDEFTSDFKRDLAYCFQYIALLDNRCYFVPNNSYSYFECREDVQLESLVQKVKNALLIRAQI